MASKYTLSELEKKIKEFTARFVVLGKIQPEAEGIAIGLYLHQQNYLVKNAKSFNRKRNRGDPV